MIGFIAWGTNIAGGVQNLIINLSIYLTGIGENITIFGYSHCHIVQSLRQENVRHDFVDIDKIPSKKINENIKKCRIIVVTSFSPLLKLYKLRHTHLKLLYWNVFPTSLIEANKIGPLTSAFLSNKLFHYLLKNDGIIFMDYLGVEELNKIGNPVYLDDKDIKYLPIPVVVTDNIYQKKFKTKPRKLEITYIGRGSIWKVLPIVKFIEDFNELNLDLNVDLHIITQEPNEYKKLINNKNLLLNIIYKDNLHGNDCMNYLRENSILHISMGTAALEGASFGIPTILIDYSMTKMPNSYKYRWLFQTKLYDLGHDANKIENAAGYNLGEIIKPFLVFNIDTIFDLSNKSYEYVLNNHDLKLVGDKLVHYTKQSKASIKKSLNFSIINNSLILFLLRLIFRNKQKYN